MTVSNLKFAVKARRFLVLMVVLHSFMLLPYCYVWIFNRTTNIRIDDGKLITSKSIYTINKKGKLKLRVEGKIHNQKNSPLMNYVKKEHVIKDFLENYKDFMRVK